MDDTLQPGCAPCCPRRDAVGERLAENPPGAASGSTPEPADLDAQMDDLAVRRQVHEPPMIPTMNLRAHSGDPERSNRLTMNTHSGDHEHRLADA